MKGVNELTCKSCKVLKSLDSFQGGKRQTNNIVCIDCDLKHNRMNNQLYKTDLDWFNEELNRINPVKSGGLINTPRWGQDTPGFRN